MSCAIPAERIEAAVAFHGHSCPGLAIGIRAAELALRELGDPADMVAVVETDMCGVDAIQFLTGCTLGKGNLIHRDLGKMAFSFFDRRAGKGFRALLRPEARGPLEREMGELMRKQAEGQADDRDEARLQALRAELQRRFLDITLEDMFDVAWLAAPPPRPPRILQSLCCEACGEMAMESRTRRFGGRTLCIPCFQRVEQKI